MNTYSAVAAAIISMAITATGCKTAKTTDAADTAPVRTSAIVGPVTPPTNPNNIMPRAVIYRMTGDATAANVPVQVSPAGAITSFPAPTDIIGQEPIALTDGYLLDRRGINDDTRFTRWTYTDYSALKSAPTTTEIKAAIIPGAKPTDIHVLDMTPWQAAADTAAINHMIKTGFATE